jgi:hypothetical protein
MGQELQEKYHGQRSIRRNNALSPSINTARLTATNYKEWSLWEVNAAQLLKKSPPPLGLS